MIPKKIHYCWFGGRDKPALVKQCIDSWKKQLPDYEIIEWNESNFDLSKSNFIKAQYEEGRWAFVADYVRIDVLKRYGGIYLDTDVEILNSLNEFLSNGFFTCFEKGMYPDQLLASTAIIGAEKNHHILKEFISFYENINLNEISSFKIPNTKILTNILKSQYGIDNFLNKTQVNKNVKIYSSDYFSPKNWATKELETSPNTYAIHHFDASWKTNKDKMVTNIVLIINKLLGPKAVKILKKIAKR